MLRLRIAVAGCGWVACNRHLPVLSSDHAFEIVGVIDRREERAAAAAAKFKVAHHAGRLSDAPWLAQVDAISVAAAPMAHHGLIKDALLLGKHVLTEKPFAMTRAEGEELVGLAEAKRLQLGIVHNFQFARSTKRLMADIASGALGTIRGVDAVQFGNPRRRLPDWYEELPLGLFYDESPHLLYLMRAIAGPLTLSRALTIPSLDGLVTPARVDAWFGCAAGYPIHLSCNFESPVSEWYLMVFGSERLGIVDVFRDIYLSLPNDGAHDARRVVTTSVVATVQHWLQHVTSGIPHLRGKLFYGNDEVFARFASSASGNNPKELEPIDARRALEVLRLQHEIIDAAAKGAPE